MTAQAPTTSPTTAPAGAAKPLTPGATIAGVGCALPAHRYEQDEITAAAKAIWSEDVARGRRVERMFQRVLVGGRNLALPIERYATLTFSEANEAFRTIGLDLAEQALREALAAAGLTPRDVDVIYTTTVTGIATPSLDARLVNRMGLRTDVRRVPMFGLGCVAGAAGIARLDDYLRGHPDEVAVLVSIELCSLTLQLENLTMANLVAMGLFGDGAAAVVAVGKDRAASMELAGRAPAVLATRSTFYPDTEDVMGWRIGDGGFHIVLSASVPQVARDHLGDDVRGFLDTCGHTTDDIDRWICHSGGPKVLEAMQETLGLPRSALEVTWKSLGEIGNLSSASVLFVLRDTLAALDAEPATNRAGTKGLVMAMGPGFCSEVVLLGW